MPQSGTSGSVGAVGGQPPAATRPVPPPVIPAKLVPDPDRGAGIHPGQPIPKLGV